MPCTDQLNNTNVFCVVWGRRLHFICKHSQLHFISSHRKAEFYTSVWRPEKPSEEVRTFPVTVIWPTGRGNESRCFYHSCVSSMKSWGKEKVQGSWSGVSGLDSNMNTYCDSVYLQSDWLLTAVTTSPWLMVLMWLSQLKQIIRVTLTHHMKHQYQFITLFIHTLLFLSLLMSGVKLYSELCRSSKTQFSAGLWETVTTNVFHRLKQNQRDETLRSSEDQSLSAVTGNRRHINTTRRLTVRLCFQLQVSDKQFEVQSTWIQPDCDTMLLWTKQTLPKVRIFDIFLPGVTCPFRLTNRMTENSQATAALHHKEK